jgi:hypothetical protein
MTASRPINTIADLHVAAVFAGAMSKTATRAADTVLRNAQFARWSARTQLPSPDADEFVADLLRDFDRLAVVIERIREAHQPEPVAKTDWLAVAADITGAQ